MILKTGLASEDLNAGDVFIKYFNDSKEYHEIYFVTKVEKGKFYYLCSYGPNQPNSFLPEYVTCVSGSARSFSTDKNPYSCARIELYKTGKSNA